MAEPPNMAVSVRLQHRNLNGTTADIRHDRRIGRIPKYVDQDRSCLNSEILRGPTPHSMRAECVKLRELTPKIRKMRSDAAVSTRMVITFGKGLQPHFDALDVESQDKIYTEIAKAVADRVATSLLALVAHRDETAPHAHGQMLAVNKFGMPISKVATPTVMSELQDMAHQIALKYLPMCERGTKKADRIKRGDDPSKIYNRSVKQLHTDLPKEIEAKQTELDAITSQIPTLTDRVAEMQARVDKLESKERSLTAAEEKRLETYQNRLVDRQAKLEEAQGELSALEGKLDSLTATIRDLEAKKAKSTDESQVAAEATQRAIEGKQAVEAALGPLEDRRDALTATIQDLEGQQAQSLAAAQKAKEEKETAEAVAQRARRDAAEAEKRAVEAQRALQRSQEAMHATEAALAPLEDRRDALTADIAGLTADFAEMRQIVHHLEPVYEMALALRTISGDPSEDQVWFEEMIPPGPDYDTSGGRDTWATALRMADPFFAPGLAPDVPRSPEPHVNADTLLDNGTSMADYETLVMAMKSEGGDHHVAVAALARRQVRLSDVRSANPSPEDQSTSSWLRRAFDGLKRGVAFAAAKVAEGAVALAGVFEALPPAAQGALHRLIRAQDMEAQRRQQEPKRSFWDPSP